MTKFVTATAVAVAVAVAGDHDPAGVGDDVADANVVLERGETDVVVAVKHSWLSTHRCSVTSPAPGIRRRGGTPRGRHGVFTVVQGEPRTVVIGQAQTEAVVDGLQVRAARPVTKGLAVCEPTSPLTPPCQAAR